MQNQSSYLSYFTPGHMSHETLEFIFVKRQKLADRLVSRIVKSVLTETKQHTLLLGPRGMGKSHLVALVYHRIKAHPDLEGKIAIAWLAEEEWGVASLTDFFLVILRALSKEYPNTGIEAEITLLKRRLRRDIEEAAGEKIREIVGQRTLLLLVENLEEIFRGLGQDGQWALRSYLSEKPFVTMLATTPTLFSGVQKQEEAFYGSFQQTYLDELDAKEATELLEKVAERREDISLAAFLKTPTALDRVQAVNDLAGGHPRIYLLFAHLLTSENLDELVTPFLQLLDELTPYYQSRMQLLTPQQRKIMEYLCDRRGAVQVKEIAEENLLDPRVVAAQLGELEKMGYVRKNAVGRESHYELREPLLRMVIEIKRSHNDEPIRLIVDFLRRWYSRPERHQRLQMAPLHAPLTRLYLEYALDLQYAVMDRGDPQRAAILDPEYLKCYDEGDFASAAELAAEIIERKGRHVTEEDWCQYAACHVMLGNSKTAIEGWDRAIDIYRALIKEGDVPVFLNNDLATLYNNKGASLATLGQYAEALFYYDQSIALRRLLIEKENDPYNLSIRLANTYTHKGFVLANMGLHPEALSYHNLVIELNSEDYKAWFNHAYSLLQNGHWCKFLESLGKGLSLAKILSLSITIYTYATGYCRLLLQRPPRDGEQEIAQLYNLYATYKGLPNLGQSLIESIPALFESDISQERADAWLLAWQKAGAEQPEMEIPLRMLKAAVEWKPKHDPRALLALPLEERRILETLLPNNASG